MPIDSSIYSQMRAPDLIGNVAKGLSVRDMIEDRAQKNEERDKQKKIDAAFSAGVIQNPDGTQGYDNKKALTALAGVGGKEYLKAKTEFQQQDIAAQKAQHEKSLNEIDLTGRILGSVNDQNSWQQGLSQAQQLGIDVSKMPTTYDPGFVNTLKLKTLTAKENLENQLKQTQSNLDADKFAFEKTDKNSQRDIERQKLGIERMKVENEKNSGDKLPIDQKKMVETLGTKNGTKLAIKNQIDSVMSTWDSLSDDQKVTTGRSLLKTLNSTEGADAIGVEEANRLGSKLEFALGNFTNSNTTQFGRDLDGFKKQALSASENIGNAVNANQKVIDQSMGRKPRQETKEWNGKTYYKVGNNWVTK